MLAEYLGKQPRTIADELEDEGYDLHEVTIETVLAAYWQHASTVCVDRRTGTPKAELSNIKLALAIVRRLFGACDTQMPDLAASKFGPLSPRETRLVTA